MTDKEQLLKDWDKATAAFLVTPPNTPGVDDLLRKAREVDAKCRAAGVLPAVPKF